MPVNVSVNSHTFQVETSTELRLALMPFGSEQFRDICLDVGEGAPRLFALLNGDVGWLMYLRHDEGDAGFSSRNPSFDGAKVGANSPAHMGRFNDTLVPVISYQLANGQVDEYPASWALPEQEITRALEYFVEHDGSRAPFVHWHDDGS